MSKLEAANATDNKPNTRQLLKKLLYANLQV